MGEISVVMLIITELLMPLNLCAKGEDSLKVITDLSLLRTKPQSLIARNYLVHHWQRGNIYLFTQEVIRDQEIRYDMDNNLIEIKTPGAIKMVEAFRISEFEWYDNDHQPIKFRNCAGYEFESWLDGFYQILAEGKISLLVKYEIGYDTEHQTGSVSTQRFVDEPKPDKIDENHYIAVGKSVSELPTRKKDILSFFGELAAELESYAKKNNLSFRFDQDLARIIAHYNQLAGQEP